MRSLSELIARSRRADEKPAGPVAATLFVAVMLAAATGLAYWIGNSISGQTAAPMVAAAELYN